MSSKRSAAKTTPKPKVERKPKTPSMPLALKFEVMAMVKSATIAVPDVTLARLISEKIGRTVQPSTVSEYRKQFGLPSVKKPSVRQMEVWNEKLRAQIVELGGTPVALPTEDDQPKVPAAEKSDSDKAFDQPHHGHDPEGVIEVGGTVAA